MRRIALIIPTVAVAGLALIAGCSGSSGGDSCLTGSWQPADLAELGAAGLEEMGGSADITMKFSGSDLSINVSMSMMGQEVTYTAKGKYSTSGNKITVSNMTGESKINGEVQQGDLGIGTLGNGEATFTCSGNTMTIEGSEFTRK